MRPTSLALILLAACTPPPAGPTSQPEPPAAPQSESDATASAREAEARVASSVPMRVRGEVTANGPGMKASYSIAAELAPGNRLHVSVTGIANNNPVERTFASDGKTTTLDAAAPSDLASRFAAGWLRAGMLRHARDLLRERGITEPPTISNPARATTDDRGTVLQFEVAGELGATTVELILDPETGLPTSRRARIASEAGPIQVEETYEIETDAKFERSFALASSCAFDEPCLMELCHPERGTRGCEYLGISLTYGLGRDVDRERGLTYFRTGCVYGDAPSCVHATALTWAEGNRKLAEAMQKRGSELGVEIPLGARQATGYTGMRLSRILCEHGSADDDCFSYLRQLELYDPERSRAGQEAMCKRYGPACYAMGHDALYDRNGKMVADRAPALELLTRGCELDSAQACGLAASVYKKDPARKAEAERFGKRACELGETVWCAKKNP